MVLTSRVGSAYCKKPVLRKLPVLKTRNISKLKSETFHNNKVPYAKQTITLLVSESCLKLLKQNITIVFVTKN